MTTPEALNKPISIQYNINISPDCLDSPEVIIFNFLKLQTISGLKFQTQLSTTENQEEEIIRDYSRFPLLFAHLNLLLFSLFRIWI